jgi:hypothetical protein
MGATLLMRPPLTLEHLEHGDFFGVQRVALDLLQAHGRKAAFPRVRNIRLRLSKKMKHSLLYPKMAQNANVACTPVHRAAADSHLPGKRVRIICQKNHSDRFSTVAFSTVAARMVRFEIDLLAG